MHPNQITQWRAQLLEGASGIFGAAVTPEPAPAVDVKTLHAKIGELTLDLGFYNRMRPHSSLGGQTPDRAYLNQPTPIPAAAQPRRRSTQQKPGSCSDRPSHVIVLNESAALARLAPLARCQC